MVNLIGYRLSSSRMSLAHTLAVTTRSPLAAPGETHGPGTVSDLARLGVDVYQMFAEISWDPEKI
jgi:hypothetical protein